MKWLKLFWDRSFTDRRYRVAMHVIFWAFLLFFWLQESMVVKINLQQHYSITLLGITLSLFLFYPLVYIIVPLYQAKKFVWASLLTILYYVIAIFLRTYTIAAMVEWYNTKQTWFAGQDFLERFYKTQLQPLPFLRLLFSSVTSLLEIIFVPLIIKFIRYAYKVNTGRVALEKENVLLELNFLKAQLNPHFLFNTLNNLQSFIVHGDSKRSVELLNKLADFIRTSLYECNTEYIPVHKEAAMINNYIEIEKVRYDGHTNITCDIQTPDEATIPSLLLIPLVENAFKYSSFLPAEEVEIHITLQSKNGAIYFCAQNRYNVTEETGKPGGIGLQNVRKRLEHYYNKKHSMRVIAANNIFTVQIKIQP